jgi:hypothetical protein
MISCSLVKDRFQAMFGVMRDSLRYVKEVLDFMTFGEDDDPPLYITQQVQSFEK